MHELSVTEEILRIAQIHLQQSGAHRVCAIHIVIGALSSMVDDSIQYYWDIISAGTPAAGARLDFRRIPLTYRCQQCLHSFTASEWTFTCPACASDAVQLIAGDEFYIEALDVERQPAEVSE